MAIECGAAAMKVAMDKKSVGLFDRAARGILGAGFAFIVLFAKASAPCAAILSLAAIAFLATAALGICPLYNAVDVNTRETAQ